MKHYLLLNIIFILTIIGCNDDTVITDIKKYDTTIKIAERYILEQEYDKALNIYNKADKSIKNMLSSDVYNALISAVYTENWDYAIYWSEKMLKKGASKAFFEKQVFKKLKERPEWIEFKSSIDKIINSNKKLRDVEMIDSLKILSKIDQQKYCLVPSGRIDLSDAYVKTNFIDSLLLRLMKNRGFPTEEKVGAYITRDTFVSPTPKFYALLRHSYQSNSKLIDDDLKDAVSKGYIKNEIYNSLIDIDVMDYIVIDCKIYGVKLTNDKSGYSKDQKLIRKKIINNNTSNDFFFYAPLSILSNDNNQKELSDLLEVAYDYLIDYSKCRQ